MIDERDELIERIGRMQRDLGRLVARDRSLPVLASNLTMRQLKVVLLLSSLGSASGQDLARNLGVSLATVTGIVDRLVRHGLATRREDPEDRRVRRVELTPDGKNLIEEIHTAGLIGLRRVLDRLDLETLRMLDHVTTRLRQVTQELHDEQDRCGGDRLPPADPP
ncbi:MarR family transcriptional regulator [Spongiactinospora sp. TRM90649]|uniref:MarR family winged helix-turn-helix transcriptional regulator n=1 Tax=Spongiactinospora sp. TRM90649 TaxID=3031114 RepID=UPI0023F82915|nr:MarR family transcriptional regulator [Spongiactinospora sp. TRM90649]MDF5756709.1 MarR family transcriptional regulator [Spongiactinospora sp. TRM90649]